MGDINLEIGLNFPDRELDDTNLDQIGVENALDERRLPNTRLALVSVVARVTESESSHFQRERCETLYTCQHQAVIYQCRLRAHLGHSASVSST